MRWGVKYIRKTGYDPAKDYEPAKEEWVSGPTYSLNDINSAYRLCHQKILEFPEYNFWVVEIQI